MLRIFACCAVLLGISSALEVTINYGKQNGAHFSVLNLQHSEPFECQEFSNTQGEVTRIVCVIKKTPMASFSPTSTIFFKFWNRVIDGEFYLYIEPNFSAKLFNTYVDLRDEVAIPKERPKKSKKWQIIGYKDRIPFLSSSSTAPQGLNFPILIAHDQENFVHELDVNRAPLEFEEGQDFTYYLGIQDMMKNAMYLDAIKTIDETLRAFPESIFVKDLMYYRLKALQEVDPQENADAIIDMGTKWVKRYPTDMYIPEVLYYVGNAYNDIRFSAESKYFYERLISEYPNSRFAPLAKMQLAKNYYGLSDSPTAMRLFVQAYQEAKDLDSASVIALNWSEFYIESGKKAEAQKLIDTLMLAYPQFLGKNPAKTEGFIRLLAESEMWESAAKMSESLYTQLQDDMTLSREEVLNRAALYYQNAQQYEKSHELNNIFMQEFGSKARAQEVKERDDKMLFFVGVDDDDAKKIERYEYLIQKYPNTDIAQKAAELKSQILFAQGRYSELLGAPNEELAHKSYHELILKAQESKDCPKIAEYFTHYNRDEFSQEQNLGIFECLYDLSLNKQAQEVITGMAQAQNDMGKKLEILYREARNLDKLGNPKQATLASRDALSIARGLGQSTRYDVGFVLFKNLMALDNLDEAREVYTFLHQHLGDDMRMIDVELELLKHAQERKEETSIELYAHDILRLQDLHNTANGTPYVELALAQSYMRLGAWGDSNAILGKLLQKDITPSTRAQALYLQGSNDKNTKDYARAKESFESCQKIQGAGVDVWQNLCAEGLKLLQ